jgi:Ca2+-binding RTX toxin-like protein
MTAGPRLWQAVAIVLACMVVLGGGGRASSFEGWYGHISVTYTYREQKQQTANAYSSMSIRALLTIVARSDGTATVSTSYVAGGTYVGYTCSVADEETTTETGKYRAPAHPPTVTWNGNHYSVSFESPSFDTRTKRTYTFPGNPGENCSPKDTVESGTGIASVPIKPIKGVADSSSRSLSGTLAYNLDLCKGSQSSTCHEVTRVSWGLRRAGGTGTVSAGGGSVVGTGAGGTAGGGGVAGAGCVKVITGTNGPDRIEGSSAAERIHGLGGNDRIDGGGGNDCIYGDAGDDVLVGGPGNDILSGGPGRDTFDAGPGNDLVLARDGVAEHVDCGPGRDTVEADATDRLVGCEIRK